MATVMGAAPHVSSVGVGVVETSSRKTVRLSVDSGAPDNVAETALPSLTVSAPTATVETTRAAMERAASASEIEPTLLLAATIFVQVTRSTVWWQRPFSIWLLISIFCVSFPQELTENAKIEADRRLHPPSETQVRSSKIAWEFSFLFRRRMNVVHDVTTDTRKRCASCESWLGSALLLVDLYVIKL